VAFEAHDLVGKSVCGLIALQVECIEHPMFNELAVANFIAFQKSVEYMDRMPQTLTRNTSKRTSHLRCLDVA
jgi:hypothetical protein